MTSPQLSLLAYREKSLAEARIEVDKAAREPGGTKCPCCQQHVQVYARSFNANMARFLISLVRTSTTEAAWVHYSKLDFNGRDYAYVRHWKLATTEHDAKGKRTSGLWLPTPRGRAFANKEITIPSHATVLNNAVIGFSDDAIDIVAALGTSFDYDKLMRGEA